MQSRPSERQTGPPPQGTFPGGASAPPSYGLDGAEAGSLNGLPDFQSSTLTKSVTTRIDARAAPRILVQPEVSTDPLRRRVDSNKLMPPSVTSLYHVTDRNNAPCRYIRSSLALLPAHGDTLKASNIPFGIVVEPFPRLHPEERPLPVVDFRPEALPELGGESFFPRCTNKHCGAFISGQIAFQNSRKLNSHVPCHICQEGFPVPPFYTEALRLHDQAVQAAGGDPRYIRYELFHGAIDSVSLPSKEPSGFAHMFVVDTTTTGLVGGGALAVFHGLKQIVKTVDFPVRIALATFDAAFTCWAAVNGKPAAYIMPNTTDPFAVVSAETALFNLPAQRTELMEVLEFVSQHYRGVIERVQQSTEASSISGCTRAAIRAATSVLGTLPLPGAVVTLVLSSEQSADDTDDSSLVSECIVNGVSVDFIVTVPPKCSVGLPALAHVPRHTGGAIHYLGQFNIEVDYAELGQRMFESLTIPKGLNCLVKLRCPPGIRVKKLLSPMSMNSPSGSVGKEASVVRLPRLDADSALAFELEYTGDLEDRRRAAFQLVVLHKDIYGRRVHRILTLTLEVTSSLQQVFRYTDPNCVSLLLTREFALAHGFAEADDDTPRKTFEKRVVDTLYGYRLHCAANSSSDQLILPESLKHLVLMMTGALKNPAFRHVRCVSDEEDRQANYLFLLQATPLRLSLRLYPRLFPLYRLYDLDKHKHERLEFMGLPPDGEEVGGHVCLTPNLPTSGTSVVSDGAFLLQTGLEYLLYLGADLPLDFVSQIVDPPPKDLPLTDQTTPGMQVNRHTALGREFILMAALLFDFQLNCSRAHFGVSKRNKSAEHRSGFLSCTSSGPQRT
ncbi:MAG: uncharacterized protein KVP18_004941 [Porospora cf. gigantea A]|nr:MAG: hypothetical protein KVP18_004941 [Porospora cf. gigantea A]